MVTPPRSPAATPTTSGKARYRCKHCGKTTLRDSDKQWIASYCETSGRTTRLWRLTAPHQPQSPEQHVGERAG